MPAKKLLEMLRFRILLLAQWLRPRTRIRAHLLVLKGLQLSFELIRSQKKIVAVLVGGRGHLTYAKDTIAHLRQNGYLMHFFTLSDNIAACKEEAASNNVYDLKVCKKIPYPIILTPATHISSCAYKHDKSIVIHMPHSMVSFHTIFSANTFQSFDHILCCGPHHIREAEAIFKVLQRSVGIHAAGYEYIDRLSRMPRATKSPNQRSKILVAPTWGEASLLAVHGREIVDCLVPKWDVILRPHPHMLQLLQPVINSLVSSYSNDSCFKLDLCPDATESLTCAEILISDASGIAFEFALAFLRPVIFVNGPRKNGHLPWRDILEEDGVEVRCRQEIGLIANSSADLPHAVEDALANLPFWSDKLVEARGRLLFNFGSCAVSAAELIDNILKRLLQSNQNVNP
jgi:hypothetical protein